MATSMSQCLNAPTPQLLDTRGRRADNVYLSCLGPFPGNDDVNEKILILKFRFPRKLKSGQNQSKKLF